MQGFVQICLVLAFAVVQIRPITGKCLVEFKGKSEGQFSYNHSCQYDVYPTSPRVELKFDDIHIPPSSSVQVTQTSRASDPSKTEELATLRSEDSGKTRYFKSEYHRELISIPAAPNGTTFTCSFKPFVTDRTENIRGHNGTIFSPYYPETYLKGVKVTYHVEVPNGHVMLHFTEVRLAKEDTFSDRIFVYDGNSTANENELGRIQGSDSTAAKPTKFLSSGNILTVKFFSFSEVLPGQMFRFKAVFTTITNVTFCKSLADEWPNSHAVGNRNLTLPGRKTTFQCNKDYVDTSKNSFTRKGVTRTCNFSGEWEHGDALKCLRGCPKLDDKIRGNSSLRWTYSRDDVPPYEGSSVSFTCGSFTESLVGSEKITCTSSGKYSALPPTCQKRPTGDGSSLGNIAWKYMVFVALVLFF